MTEIKTFLWWVIFCGVYALLYALLVAQVIKWGDVK
jgi:hypothetical protein